MSKEKKNESKKMFVLTFSDELSAMTDFASEFMQLQEGVSKMMEQMEENAKSIEEMRKAFATSQTIISLNSIAEQYADIFKSVSVPEIDTTRISQAMSEIKTAFSRASEMIAKAIPTKDIAIETMTILQNNNTLVRSLLREIELLESKIAEKEKTISSQDNQIKRLHKLLEEKRNELKEQCVA